MLKNVFLGIMAVAFGFGLRMIIDRKRGKAGKEDLKISFSVYLGLLIIVFILAYYFTG